MKHLLFYDGTCGLCDKSVQMVLKLDKQENFAFAPLQGKLASELLQDLPEKFKNVDSLILIENYQSPDRNFYVMGKGAIRIFWLLGGVWKPFGLFSFLPSFLFDPFYRLIAKHRHHFFDQVCVIPTKENRHRFLD